MDTAREKLLQAVRDRNTFKPEGPFKGLKALRNHPNDPLTLCENCHCHRYGVCKCMRKKSGSSTAISR